MCIFLWNVLSRGHSLTFTRGYKRQEIIFPSMNVLHAILIDTLLSFVVDYLLFFNLRICIYLFSYLPSVLIYVLLISVVLCYLSAVLSDLFMKFGCLVKERN
jgi:dolichyl-phosphate-mannose--protein O-mannosyl transferase